MHRHVEIIVNCYLFCIVVTNLTSLTPLGSLSVGPYPFSWLSFFLFELGIRTDTKVGHTQHINLRL